VLIITGETSSAALREANERSYTLLQKPIAPEVLRLAIAAAMSEKIEIDLAQPALDSNLPAVR
jgi:hypothetical protein